MGGRPVGDVLKLLPVVSRDMSPLERRQFRQLTATLDAAAYDTMPKQHMILDYIRARNELEELRMGWRAALRAAANDPDNEEVIMNLGRWQNMTSKIKSEIDRLRTMCGMTAKYETQLHKAKQVKGAPKGGHDIKPWDNIG